MTGVGDIEDEMTSDSDTESGDVGIEMLVVGVIVGLSVVVLVDCGHQVPVWCECSVVGFEPPQNSSHFNKFKLNSIKFIKQNIYNNN